jgi:hypothetical protein
MSAKLTWRVWTAEIMTSRRARTKSVSWVTLLPKVASVPTSKKAVMLVSRETFFGELFGELFGEGVRKALVEGMKDFMAEGMKEFLAEGMKEFLAEGRFGEDVVCRALVVTLTWTVVSVHPLGAGVRLTEPVKPRASAVAQPDFHSARDLAWSAAAMCEGDAPIPAASLLVT